MEPWWTDLSVSGPVDAEVMDIYRETADYVAIGRHW